MIQRGQNDFHVLYRQYTWSNTTVPSLETGADLEERRLHLHKDAIAAEREMMAAGKAQRSAVLEMRRIGLICCPED